MDAESHLLTLESGRYHAVRVSNATWFAAPRLYLECKEKVMPEENRQAGPSTSQAKPEPAAKDRSTADKAVRSHGIYLVPYPKIILLYPILLASIAAAIAMHVLGNAAGQEPSRSAILVAEIFLAITAVNMVILAFDFPRATSLTLFFFVAALVMGFVLLVTFKPEIMPAMRHAFDRLQPAANATFYWSVAGILVALYIAVFISVRFDYWEIRPNELLHHHGILSDLERLSAPNLRIEKEINDVFEYFLLRSGRLVLHPSDDRRAIILDNVPFIDRKEESVTRMLGALQVKMMPDN